MSDVAERAAPHIEAVSPTTDARAMRIEERCNYAVTGYVLTHRTLPKKAIVDMAIVRWYPNEPEFNFMMTGRKDTPGPGTPPAEALGDEMLCKVPEPVKVAPASIPTTKRPVLTAPPTAKLLESTEAALAELARELGCVPDETVPHNAGWFVPGKPTAYASAYDAIRGLVATLKSGGTVYESKPVITPVDGTLKAQDTLIHAKERPAAAEDRAPKRKSEPQPAIEQGALF